MENSVILLLHLKDTLTLERLLVLAGDLPKVTLVPGFEFGGEVHSFFEFLQY